MRLYLDTSTWSFLFVQDAPDKRSATERLFEEIAAGKHEPLVSALVIEEVENMKHIVRHKTRQFVRAQALLLELKQMDLVTPEEVIE